jgi:hypothetical protein
MPVYYNSAFGSPTFWRYFAAAAERGMFRALPLHDGRALISAAQLCRGQATNFWTPGGGFVPVFAKMRLL